MTQWVSASWSNCFSGYLCCTYSELLLIQSHKPVGIATYHQKLFSDGVAASLTSLGCLCILLADRGEIEASGRGSLHGHWEIWALSALVANALERFSDKLAAERLRLMKRVVYGWINFFQHSPQQRARFAHGFSS